MGRGKNSDKKAGNALTKLIDAIPAEKLSGFPDTPGTIWKNKYFRLDMQGMSTGKPKCHNMQIQINKGIPCPSISALGEQKAYSTVAEVQVPQDGSMSRDTLRANLHHAKVFK